jgi:hypothetical protein
VQLLLVAMGALSLPAMTFRQIMRHFLPGGPSTTFLILATLGAMLWLGLRRDALAGRTAGASPSSLLAPLLLPFLVGLLGSLQGFARTAETLDDTFDPIGAHSWVRIAIEGSAETLEPGMMGALLSGYLLLAAAGLAVARSRLGPATAIKATGLSFPLVALVLLTPLGLALEHEARGEIVITDLLLGLALFAGALLVRRARRHEADGLLARPLQIVKRAIPLASALLGLAAFELIRSNFLGIQAGESIDPEQALRIRELGTRAVELRAALGIVETAAIGFLLGSLIGPAPQDPEIPRSWRLAGAIGLGAALQLGVEAKIHGALADARALFVRFHEQPDLVLPLTPRFGDEFFRAPVVYVPRIGDLRYDGTHGKKPTELFGDGPIERYLQQLDTLGAAGGQPPSILLIAADREAPVGTVKAVANAATRLDPGMAIALLARTSPLAPETCPEESCVVALATVHAAPITFQRAPRPRPRPTYGQLHLGAEGPVEGEATAGQGATLSVSEQARCGQLLAALAELAARGVGPVEVEVEGEAVAAAAAGDGR